jgi:hypothetical protein
VGVTTLRGEAVASEELNMPVAQSSSFKQKNGYIICIPSNGSSYIYLTTDNSFVSYIRQFQDRGRTRLMAAKTE